MDQQTNSDAVPLPLIQVRSLRKAYRMGQQSIDLFNNLSLVVPAGELLAIVGESGTGKSTLLHLLAAMDRPTAGSVQVQGIDLDGLDRPKQADFRNKVIGYVWQFHYLLPEFSALENVAMPLLASGWARDKALAEAKAWLQTVKLNHRADHRAGELSGGEQQRASLARALVTRPKLLLADEPTGNLDEHTAEVIFALLQSLHRAHGLTSVLVTHHLGFARRCDRVLALRDGTLYPITDL